MASCAVPELCGASAPPIQPGDANLDQQFDTADIVAVLAANKFEKDEPATWAEGDWNGDRDFTTDDLILLLATLR